MENRKHPRRSVLSEQGILHFEENHEFSKTLALYQNVSATGCCFRSTKSFHKGHYLLINSNETLLEVLNDNPTKVMRFGTTILARVVWVRSLGQDEGLPLNEVGCAFVSVNESSQDHINLMMDLINFETLKGLKTQ